MLETTTLTSKGQVTVPRQIRERLGLQPGDKMTFSVLGDGTVVMRAKNRKASDLAGIVRQPRKEPVPLEKMRVELTEDDIHQ